VGVIPRAFVIRAERTSGGGGTGEGEVSVSGELVFP
jgi:hypothetical protein